MSRFFRNFSITLLLILSLTHCSCGSSSESTNTTTVTIETSSGSFQVTAEVADSDSERQQGLMERESLGANSGMLFVFDEAGRHSFWMQNTTISLDIIWLSASKSVVYIEEDTTPLSLDRLVPTEDALYVLEVNAGYVADKGLQVGDVMSFSL